jgi:hypothetical protein
MPTVHKRIQVTADPRVQRIVDVGSTRWPGRGASAVLVGLAQERADQLVGMGSDDADPLASLITVVGPPITTELVARVLADED